IVERNQGNTPSSSAFYYETREGAGVGGRVDCLAARYSEIHLRSDVEPKSLEFAGARRGDARWRVGPTGGSPGRAGTAPASGPGEDEAAPADAGDRAQPLDHRRYQQAAESRAV